MSSALTEEFEAFGQEVCARIVTDWLARHTGGEALPVPMDSFLQKDLYAAIVMRRLRSSASARTDRDAIVAMALEEVAVREGGWLQILTAVMSGDYEAFSRATTAHMLESASPRARQSKAPRGNWALYVVVAAAVGALVAILIAAAL